MANRVIMGSFNGDYRLRISAPGYDVLNTGLVSPQLRFSTDWGRLGNIWMQGTITMGANTTQDLMFGRTFTLPPSSIVYGTNYAVDDYGAYVNGYAYTYTDRLRIYNNFGATRKYWYYVIATY